MSLVYCEIKLLKRLLPYYVTDIIILQQVHGSFPPPLDSFVSEFLELHWNVYLKRALFSCNCVPRLGKSSLAPLLPIRVQECFLHPVCFLLSGHAAWKAGAARQKHPGPLPSSAEFTTAV